MKPQFRLCVMMAVVAVIVATFILSALPDTAQASSNKIYVNLKLHNKYGDVNPPPNDVRILARGYRYVHPNWVAYWVQVLSEWSYYYPGSWSFLSVPKTVISKFGHRDLFSWQGGKWSGAIYRIPWGRYLYYRWDWTRNCSFYLRGGGWAIRYSEPDIEKSGSLRSSGSRRGGGWASQLDFVEIRLPEAAKLADFADSVSTQDPDTLMASYVVIDSVQWANSPEPIPIDELTLTGTSGLAWTSPDSTHVIVQGDSVLFPEVGLLDPPQIGGPTVVMKGRFQTAFDHPDSISHWTAFVMQFAEEPETPATSRWGIVFLAVGLLSVALILVLRRRRILART